MRIYIFSARMEPMLRSYQLHRDNVLMVCWPLFAGAVILVKKAVEGVMSDRFADVIERGEHVRG